jgi:hypothetical protein
MIDLSLDTTEKVISAIAGLLAIAGAVAYYVKRSGGDPAEPNGSPKNTTSQNVTVSIGHQLGSSGPATPPGTPPSVPELKRNTHVLFVDDDRGFKIVGVLKKMGWEHAKLVADIGNLEQQALVDAQVVFVDIQGVGRMMRYNDEGLGLALAIKRRYPAKKVVIYSAEETGARFHEALQEADYSLPKTAEPIRFEDTIVRVLTK